jgi:hypothetical protein
MRKPHEDDVILWPNGDWCARGQLSEMTHLSDDYRVLPTDTSEWCQFLAAIDAGMETMQ